MTGVGLVGIGNWGANWLRTLATLPGTHLRWCCDFNVDLLASVAATHESTRTTRDFAELLRDEKTVAVVIATSAPTHFDLARQALQAGKHVMVEKPMTLTSADARQLVHLASDCGSVLMVGHLMEYHPALPAIREMIDRGEVGDIRRLELRRSNHGILRTDEDVWWSLAPHDISMALRLLGEWPEAIACSGQNIVQPRIADVVTATIRFRGGQVAKIDASWHDPVKVRELKVYGSKHWVVFDDMQPWERKVIVHDRGFDEQAGSSGARRFTVRRGQERPLALPKTEPLVAEASHFIECVQAGRRPLSDGLSGEAVVSVLEAGTESLRTGREVRIARPAAA